MSVLDMSDKNDNTLQKNRKKEMAQYFKKPENQSHAWDPKLLEKVIMYLSIVNYGC